MNVNEYQTAWAEPQSVRSAVADAAKNEDSIGFMVERLQFLTKRLGACAGFTMHIAGRLVGNEPVGVAEEKRGSSHSLIGELREIISQLENNCAAIEYHQGRIDKAI